ncbi:flagellin [Teredinibacter sp. KSP-S5-2]|uniref:flagellin n=1 Tax=Teredinibacter sp. KSP-S5-2 TaxID=3034506 RepID=UPI0029342B73|nr:flagellin [Teredinibacter sp. KSP-S5-2]WNO09770.1 flagellin [Teredinibacter sp. KSP-S5-2]
MKIPGSSLSNHIQSATQTVYNAAKQIASGKRINSAGDDPAGQAISQRMGANIRGFTQSIRNANDGISFLQAQDAGISGLSESIQRIRELAIQSGNGTLSDNDRQLINKEASQLLDEVNRTLENSSFNNQPLYAQQTPLQLQIGAKENQTLTLEANNLQQSFADIGFANIDLSNSESANASLAILDQAQGQLNQQSATLGAGLNRLSSSMNSLYESIVQTEDAQSRIEDADIAKAASELTAGQIRTEVGIALQAQANQRPSLVLQLLQGNG